MPEHDLQSVAFPRLDPSQIEALSGYAAASLVHYDAGQKLFHVGDRDYRFFVVASGEVEIVDESGETPKTISAVGEGAMAVQFVHEYLKEM